MQHLIIVSTLIGSLGLVFTVFLSFYFYTHSGRKVNKGHLIYKVDFVRRKIILLKTKFNVYAHLSLFSNPIKFDKWKNLDLFLKNFESSNKTLEKIKEMLNYASLKNEDQYLSFKHKSSNSKSEYLIKMEITHLSEESDFQLHLFWEKNNQKIAQNQLKTITQEEIVKNKFKFKGFISFHMNSNILNSNKYFLNLLAKQIKIKNHYFIWQNLIVFTFFSSSSKKSKKKVSKFIEKINQRKSFLGKNRFFKGTSYVLTKNVTKLNKLNYFLNFLKFCCLVSSEKREDFISKRNNYFKNEDYLEYLKNLKEVKFLLKSKNFSIDNKIITSVNTNRKITNYFFPKLDKLQGSTKSFLLKDLMYSKLITNSFAEEMLFNKENADKTFLIDVYDNWIITNHENLFLKKAVYVVNINNKRKIPSNLVSVLNDLSQKGFTLALKVKKDHIIIENLMNAINFKFFIIDKDFLEDFSDWKFIDLMLVKKIATKNKVRMIFNGKNENLDLMQKEKIGFHFFY